MPLIPAAPNKNQKEAEDLKSVRKSLLLRSGAYLTHLAEAEE